jgi:uncharacterized protein YceK
MTTLQLRYRPPYWLLIVAALFVLAYLLSGCSSSRHVVKSTTDTEQQRTATVDTRTNTEDRTVTTVTVTADTAITVPGVKVQSESIGTQSTVETSEGTLATSYDPVRNIIRSSFTAKPRSVPVKVERRTEIKADIKQQTVQKTDSASTVRTTTTVKDKTTRHNWIWFGLGGLVLFGVLAYLFYRWLKTRILF